VGGTVKLVATLLLVASCFYSQSDHCGDEYLRNMTHVKDGLYRIDGDPIAGSKQLRLQRAGDKLIITTDDGRSAQYHVR
jgi:hypothetical protein